MKSMKQSFIANKNVFFEITTGMTVGKRLKKIGIPSEAIRGFFF